MTPSRARTLQAAAVFFGCLLLFNLNGDVLPGHDATPHLYTAASLIEDGDLVITPEEAPELFTAPSEPPYYLASTQRDGRYVSGFDFGAAIAALPVIAAAAPFSDADDLRRDPATLWYAGKLAASLFISGAVLFLFLIARRYGSLRDATLIAITAAAATNLWAVSSQTLWQHAPATFFLAAALHLIATEAMTRRRAALLGAALAAATLCRPTLGLFAVAGLIHMLREHRAQLVPFLAAAAPFAAAMLAWQLHHFGAPFTFGQAVIGERIATIKTGEAEVWRFDFAESVPGLLLSPSRGLFVYSPVLLFSLWGAARLWRSPDWAWLRPMAAAGLALFCVEAAHFDWWGGWSFGYRHIVDLVPLLALLLLPALPEVLDRAGTALLFAALLVASVGVQIIGAFAYNTVDWNARAVHVAFVAGEPVATGPEAALREAFPEAEIQRRTMDIDAPAFRERLHDWSDSQLLHYALHFSEARARKQELIERWLAPP